MTLSTCFSEVDEVQVDGSTSEEQKLTYLKLIQLRLDSLFEITADFPDSLPAILELKRCLIATRSMDMFSKEARRIYSKRLLHLGASTTQIIDMYVLIIRTLSHLDASDMLLTRVTSPIRSYLTHRKDTIKCIVKGLTEESELYAELRKGGKSFEVLIDEEDETEGPGEHWNPPKRHLNALEKDDSTGAYKKPDILAILVSIYRSKELFIDEYRSILARRLLTMSRNSNSEGRTSKQQEIATVELLKIRYHPLFAFISG